MPESDLIAKLVVGRIGELNRWWDSEALSPPGRAALQRLFPRTWPVQAVLLNGRSALLKHKGLVRKKDGLTLFGRLDAGDFQPPESYEDLNALAAELAPVLERLDTVARGGLETALLSMEAISPPDLDWLRSQRLKPQGSSMAIGRVSVSDLENRETCRAWVRRLAAAYTLSLQDNLCAPFLEIA